MKRSALGIAAVCVAIALPCALAPAQASATVLCKVQSTPCGGANIYTWPQVVTGEVPKLGTTEIITEFATVTCLENPFGITTTNTGGKGLSVVGRVTTLAFVQCTVPDGKGGSENCTVKAVNAGPLSEEQYLAFFTANAKSPGNGELGFAAGSKGPMGFAVSCAAPPKVECTFEGSPSLTVTGGPVGGVAGTISGSASMKPNAGGAKCPKAAATWKVNWKIIGPASLFLEPE